MKLPVIELGALVSVYKCIPSFLGFDTEKKKQPNRKGCKEEAYKITTRLFDLWLPRRKLIRRRNERSTDCSEIVLSV